MLFRDRVDAGLRLAERLGKYRRAQQTLVLGIPRGGIIVAGALAERLELPIGICPVRKLGAPGNPELAIGAVDDEDGSVVDQALLQRLGIRQDELEPEMRFRRTELRQWMAQLGGDSRRLQPGEQAILTDDGIATGSTAHAGVQSLRRRGAKRVVLAVPVAPRESLHQLVPLVDEWICLMTPQPFYAVGNFYATWPQVSDAEVRAALAGPPTRDTPS